MNEVRYTHLRPEQFDKRLKKFPVCFLPLGSLEWHYLHLPLGTDYLEAEAMCIGAAKRCGGIVFPPLWLSIRGMTRARGKKFYRNIKISEEFFKQIVDTIIQECIDVGFKMILLSSGHGGTDIYEKLAYEWYSSKKAVVLCPSMGHFTKDTGLMANNDHASFTETSYTSYVAPDAVDLDKLKKISGKYTIAGLKKHYAKIKSDQINMHDYCFSPGPDNILHDCYVEGLDPRLGANSNNGRIIAGKTAKRLAEFAVQKYAVIEQGKWPAFDLPLTTKKCWQTCKAYQDDFRQKDGVKRPSCLQCSEASEQVFRHLLKKWGKDLSKRYFTLMLKIAKSSPLYKKSRIRFMDTLLKSIITSPAPKQS